jgi:Flp pilus assembly secretin CpaC
MPNLALSLGWMPRRWIEASIAAIALLAAAAGAARAQDITVALDMATPVRLAAPAEGVAVGNPTIAGVSLQNDRLLFVTGRAYGATNLVVVGAGGRTILSGRITVTPDETNQIVVVRGMETQRLACTPICRPQPDIGDPAFETVQQHQIQRMRSATDSR